jgi:hypothetical protein
MKYKIANKDAAQENSNNQNTARTPSKSDDKEKDTREFSFNIPTVAAAYQGVEQDL